MDSHRTDYIDNLTNILNRFALMEYLKEIESGSLFLINVDNFHSVNDAYGFDNGDTVLIEIARFINMSKPISTKLFRVSSDEFVVVAKEMMDSDKLGSIASSIVSFFDQMEIVIDGDIDVNISVSIGISAGDSDLLLNQARIAIKELREYERSDYKIYDKNSIYILKQQENIYWIHKIKNAFIQENITAYYQPIINNETKKIEKYECLVRIIEEGVLIPPIRFLEASRLTGTLSLVTKTIIDKSFNMFSNTDYEFSINITGTDLHLGYLGEYLLKYSTKYNIHPSRVVLEILEDIETIDEPEKKNQLDSLREHGFKIAIDDFGSQSSNFSRLLDFSPDYLKIDGSFIKNILTDKNSLVIVEAIVLLCKKSNIKMIAEFVHSKEIQEKVEELGIEYSQGYYFSEPKAEIQY